MSMKLKIKDNDIPVDWELNQAVYTLNEDAQKSPINVKMEKYGGFEQVGFLGKNYPRSDKHIKTEVGDIVLYNGNKIVIFYGQNSWSYTKLGRIKLSDNQIVDLLSNEELLLTLTS